MPSLRQLQNKAVEDTQIYQSQHRNEGSKSFLQQIPPKKVETKAHWVKTEQKERFQTR